MASIECGRGHLYDPEKHATCPYCNTNQQITVAAAGKTAPIPTVSAAKTAPIAATAPQKTAPLTGVSVTAPQKTAPLSAVAARAAAPVPTPTQPPHSYGVSVEHAGKTVGMAQAQLGFDPVVGWLVCTEGPSKGKSYTLHGGINSIGRGERMDVVITGDMKISSENQAKLSYSGKNNRFNLIPADGKNITYLNDEEVFAAMPLKAYDIIDFGETKLMFIPLCGEGFVWQKDNPGGGGNGTV